MCRGLIYFVYSLFLEQGNPDPNVFKFVYKVNSETCFETGTCDELPVRGNQSTGVYFRWILTPGLSPPKICTKSSDVSFAKTRKYPKENAVWFDIPIAVVLFNILIRNDVILTSLVVGAKSIAFLSAC